MYNLFFIYVNAKFLLTHTRLTELRRYQNRQKIVSWWLLVCNALQIWCSIFTTKKNIFYLTPLEIITTTNTVPVPYTIIIKHPNNLICYCHFFADVMKYLQIYNLQVRFANNWLATLTYYFLICP